MKRSEKFKVIDTQILFDTAKRLGANPKKVLPLDSEYEGYSLFEMNYKGHKEYMTLQCSGNMNFFASHASSNKFIAHTFFKKAGISRPKARAFDTDDEINIKQFIKKIGFPVVIKPNIGTCGFKVFVNIKTMKEAMYAIREIQKTKKQRLIIEEFFEGEEYRLFATPKKFLGAIHRIPANVVGDGKKSIKKLIEQKNKDPRRGDGHGFALLKIKMNKETRRILREQGLTLGSVPKQGKQIFLRKTSNLSTGGDSIDYTDKIHPSVKKIAKQAIKAFPSMPYGAVDFLTKDVTRKQTKKSYRVIEVNFCPMLSMHHYPYKGKSRDVASEIILDLYPELRK